ncbi:hypothetical protein D3C86_1245520 [compost metagenome]
MPPCRAHIKASFVIVYSGVAAFEKNLGICDFRPWFPIHFLRRGRGFKVAFYFIWSHGTKLGKKCKPVKGSGVLLA